MENVQIPLSVVPSRSWTPPCAAWTVADGRVSLQRMPVEIDETTLRLIAEKSGGRYFHATDEAGLRDVIEEIGRLERSKVAELRYLEYDHHYRPFVAAALVATALAALLASTWLRRLPA